MTATGGGPALPSVQAAFPSGTGRAGDAARQRRAAGQRIVLGVARVEAFLLARSVLVLAGLLAGGVVIWFLLYPAVPLWWNAAWQIGDGQLELAIAVLLAGQLAAGRARRDGMADLYASFPATAGTRTLGQLAGLTGAVPASLVLIGAAVAVVQLLGPIGAASIVVLAGGLLLVIAAGAVGIAVGTRFPHPMAGILGGLALFLISSQFSGAAIWLLPWEFNQDELGTLPGPLRGYPPAGAHALELAAVAVLAGIAALAVTVSRGRARGGLAAGGILAVTVICLAGAVQVRPLPAAELNHLVAGAADPASQERCTTANQVRYCLYPGFGSLLPSLQAPVNGVLAHLPVRPPRPLTVSQILSVGLPAPDLTHGHPERQVSRWDARLQPVVPVSAAAPTIYLPVGAWPAVGVDLADAHFDVALAAADWAVQLPLATTSGQCVPFDQAREAIAIWLAILATHPPAGELQAGLATNGHIVAVWIRHTFVPLWTYPGQDSSQVDQNGTGPPLNTQAGYLLARAMTRLPDQNVARVLKDGWARWISARTTDAQLAAALGIPMPTVPGTSTPATRNPGATVNAGPIGAQSPLCTS